MVEVSRHANKRVRERFGLPKRAVNREAERAKKIGLRREEITGEFRQHIDRLYMKEQALSSPAEYITTAQGIHVFREDVLVTVLPLPGPLADEVRQMCKVKRLAAMEQAA